ncbi:MAG: molybdenum cofactor guanylyltransferase [Bryobacterales bacterium]|nr:molybdenum cofactor guanylyltransferase [Bryobacterales bacterium]
MSRAGFVLAGGRSSRMGSDKALLPFAGRALVLHVADLVAASAGSVTLIGSPERYGSLGLPLLPDLRPGEGPLAGIEAALHAASADWNLVVACDMPRLSLPLLEGLFEVAEASGADAVVPCAASGRLEPLCTVWRDRCLAAVSEALDRGERRVSVVLDRVGALRWRSPDSEAFTNVNTPADWTAINHG